MQFWKPKDKPSELEATEIPERSFHRLGSHTNNTQNDFLQPVTNLEDAESRQPSQFSQIELTEITDVAPNEASMSTFEDDDEVKRRSVDRALHSKPVATFLAWFALCVCCRRKG
ncbi:hypothetical protein CLAFUW4_10864 [Fulvia fulva]|uniref:Uncharacterized protein n=1 Tax=Passalora fulva TaxID=5499 RepID=A0A9Q8PC55_PASFU|nr:uncharacterized protein CLAFUR5_09906 [Fulvia fulva]KAK4619390.1 hypothetical protein CLAFUR4_10869 [Fulvia fulva]KAK4620340.1 hypothetical protein CLAFUR0_10876 [Fulvia fulva]UJO19738.1 hypothetical protein CLAFUR5_09906 [Fulvia fulva]WPV17743.1 hypothetical protein CLAFUW4_10864 [Fulvia fulva]WPV32256.1 hypothetical protein CLAFUW7_10862 [Fulvia fulva]